MTAKKFIKTGCTKTEQSKIDHVAERIGVSRAEIMRRGAMLYVAMAKGLPYYDDDYEITHAKR